MSNRPRLKSQAQPFRRGPGSIQLGLCPDPGVVLDGLSAAEIAVTEGLDGSMDIRTLYAVAASAGVAAGRLSALIATLDEHHLLVDPATDQLTARSTQHVVISGEGDLPCALADLLRVGGIGRVSVGTSAADILDLELRGRRAGQARIKSGSVSRLPAAPDLVVLAAVGAIHPDAGEPWLRRGVPHLPLVVQGHRVQVGPLVIRGAGPCLSCMDLHRRDRDAAWPALLSQLVPGWPFRPAAPISLDSSLTAMTTGAAAMIVHACLDGHPVPGDISLELSLPWPTIHNRRWFIHPLCDCVAGRETMAG